MSSKFKDLFTSKGRKKTIAALDFGTAKMLCLIGHIDEFDRLVIDGIGHQKSNGVTNSTVTDMRLAEESIVNAVSTAEKDAQYNIKGLVVNLTGNHLLSSNMKAEIDVAGNSVRESDINSLVASVRHAFRKQKREAVHLVPMQYFIDDSRGIRNPKHMSGDVLGADLHIVTSSFSSIRNTENCFRRCQLHIHNYISDAFASALACLSPSEMELGTTLIDIGSAGTSFAIISGGRLAHIGNIPLGGQNLTKDIAAILNVDADVAERIKILNSNLLMSEEESREMINLDSLDLHLENVNIKKYEINDIIRSRLEEIFEVALQYLQKKQVYLASSNNIVLTGGSALIPGIDMLAANILEKQARIGYPQNVDQLDEKLNSPICCSAVGMMIFLQKAFLQEVSIGQTWQNNGGFFKNLFTKIFN